MELRMPKSSNCIFTYFRRLVTLTVALFMVIGFNSGAIIPAIGGSLGSKVYAAVGSTGQITGNVFQDNGAPIPNATVKAYASSQDYDSGNIAASTTSGTDGAYDLSNLPDGNYLILVNDFNDQNSNHNFSSENGFSFWVVNPFHERLVGIL